MRVSGASQFAFPWLLSVLFFATPASAQTQGDGPNGGSDTANAEEPKAATPEPAGDLAKDQALVIVPAEPEQPVLEPIPSARDRLGGHFVLGGSAGVKWPFGSLEDGVKQSSELSTGLALNLDAGFGLSRNVVVGLWGEYDTYSKPSGCGACDADSFAGGPFLRYHLVQGTRFDPWGSIAAGVRHTRAAAPTSGASKGYTGPEWLKLSLGGDWYPSSNVGFGPYFSFGLGSYGSAFHTDISTGVRVVFDLPGK